MKLDNLTKEAFIKYFGEEGYNIIEPYDITVICINNEMALEHNALHLNAWVCPWLPKGASESEIALFFNVERIYSELSFLERALPVSRIRHYVGTMVHELTHVRQMQDGRLVSKEDCYIWNGVVYPFHKDVAEYFEQPWEIEAHIEQLKFLYEVNNEEALKLFNEKANQWIMKEKNHG